MARAPAATPAMMSFLVILRSFLGVRTPGLRPCRHLLKTPLRPDPSSGSRIRRLLDPRRRLGARRARGGGGALAARVAAGARREAARPAAERPLRQPRRGDPRERRQVVRARDVALRLAARARVE